jgi:hypothetical protein
MRMNCQGSRKLAACAASLIFTVELVFPALATEPRIAVAVSKQRVAKGEPLEIIITYENIPDGGGLVVSVVPNIPQEQQTKMNAYGGLVMLHPEPIAGSGQHVVHWDTNKFGCAPADAAMWCDGFEIGQYRASATAYDTPKFSILGWPGGSPKQIAIAKSEAFEVSGAPDLNRMTRSLDEAASSFLASELGLHGVGESLTPYLDTSADIGNRWFHGWCKTYTTKRPFAGEITSCLPSDVVGPFGVNVRRSMHEAVALGNVRTVPGILTYEKALARAREIADAPYAARIKAEEPVTFESKTEYDEDGIGHRVGDNVNQWHRRGASFELSSGVTGWQFHPQDDAWQFVIYEIQAGGLEDLPERFADNVMVRVELSGRGCLIEVRPYKGQFSEDAGKTPCPQSP